MATMGTLPDVRLRDVREQQRLSQIELAAKATDHAAVAALDAKLRELHAQREQAESKWLTTAEIVG